ncbi:chlorophyll a/b-binding protein [Umezakia ovalisporum]|jgi:hypothetical protein|uniref:Chlorophyll a/b-binding protein n=2 Tax=Umezakia ovalisporum TaxID=75695 RepID=A0AA43KEY3_9CYAN|nr:chlorophyll a/b-binding protein [Umezakia ovalisporum]MBI1241106.1 high light inducible protein [Nostoc sp. RI_552]MDH6056528.1 chlorophyll a/b-binding protein [Umezakia ovalisporum FSS-43]MDH6064046.1 chlorophyll a/b-binding protein [Umezakia ovalisporum FSS-62]MDH6065768.1 chlorophyll a/b-binding protein [Umezakia ovalisporum APH033B]MDH6069278.1 chlorophyll a/b-binding protein [Umezakia ovalisporum CobakiLakeA]
MTSKGFKINKVSKRDQLAVQQKVYVNETPKVGFTEYAEKLNGRLAMIGFVALIAVEAITGNGLIGWLTNL